MPRRILPLVVVLSAIFSAAAAAQAPKAEEAVQKACDRILGALQNGDREAFVKDATEAVRDGVTPQVMETLTKQLGPRLKAGYEATYLCPLKQAGHQIHLWKVTFKDGEDDIVVRIVFKEGKVAGFFLQ